MKTTNTENSLKSQIKDRKALITTGANSTRSNLKSARPMKSMVKLRSLKPKRIEIGTTLRRKPIKA